MDGQKVFHIKEGDLIVKTIKKDDVKLYVQEYCFVD